MGRRSGGGRRWPRRPSQRGPLRWRWRGPARALGLLVGAGWSVGGRSGCGTRSDHRPTPGLAAGCAAMGYPPGVQALSLRRPAPVEAGPLEVVDLPDPFPGPGELLGAVAAFAVCRTDLQLAEGDLEAHRLPIVPGHQAVGRVVAI